jgi:hypothetical protein
MIGRLGALVLVGLVWPLTSVLAAEPKEIGKYKVWTAYAFQDAGGKICYAVSTPTKQVGKYTRRGDVFFLVTHRPSGKVFNEISVITGYTFKNGSNPRATIGGSRFDFYAEGDAAWARQKDESGLVSAMRKGSTMVLKGVSSRGTATTDTYSLSGVSAALNKIDRECGRK